MSAIISDSEYPMVSAVVSIWLLESGASTASRNCNVTEPSAPIDALHINRRGDDAIPVNGKRRPPCTCFFFSMNREKKREKEVRRTLISIYICAKENCNEKNGERESQR